MSPFKKYFLHFILIYISESNKFRKPEFIVRKFFPFRLIRVYSISYIFKYIFIFHSRIMENGKWSALKNADGTHIYRGKHTWKHITYVYIIFGWMLVQVQLHTTFAQFHFQLQLLGWLHKMALMSASAVCLQFADSDSQILCLNRIASKHCLASTLFKYLHIHIHTYIFSSCICIYASVCVFKYMYMCIGG